MSFGALAIAAALIVVDGDTVKRPDTGERLRLEMIDAPERGHRAACMAEAIHAERASARLSRILSGGVVVEDSGKRGGFGRPLVSLRLPDGQTNTRTSNPATE